MSTEAGQMDSHPKQAFPIANQYPSAVQWQPTQNPVQIPKAAPRGIENQEDSNSKSYLLMSVLTVLFCCFPLSIFGLISSVLARSNFEAGKFSAGRKHARRALRFNIASIVLGILLNIILGGVIVYYQFVVARRFRG